MVFLLVGTFDEAPFSGPEQIANPRVLGAASYGLKAIQQSFAKSLALVLPLLIPIPLLSMNKSIENCSPEELELEALESVLL